VFLGHVGRFIGDEDAWSWYGRWSRWNVIRSRTWPRPRPFAKFMSDAGACVYAFRDSSRRIMQLVLSIASDQSVVVVDRTDYECAEFGCDKCNDEVVLRARRYWTWRRRRSRIESTLRLQISAVVTADPLKRLCHYGVMHVHVITNIVTSAKEVMFSSLFVCLCVSNFSQKLQNEIFREGWQWATERMIKFWWRSGSGIRIGSGSVSPHR